MRTFPEEFSHLVGIDTFTRICRNSSRNFKTDKLIWFPRILSPTSAGKALALVDRSFADVVRLVQSPIPDEATSKMARNYAELLPKTLSNRTALLNAGSAKATKIARDIGLLQMLQSPSLHELAERISGLRLYPNPGRQIICYRNGDYVGPHNDHHPEEPDLRRGYVDFQITLSNEHVMDQWLIFERDGILNNMVQVGVSSGLAVSFLPFWHQVTPLRSKRGRAARARRWLLLASFVVRA